MFWGTVQNYWLPTPFASFPFTSPPVRHRLPSHFTWSLQKESWKTLPNFSQNMLRKGTTFTKPDDTKIDLKRNEEKMWNGFVTFKIRSNRESLTNKHRTDTHRSIDELRSIPFPTSVHRPSARYYTNPTRQFTVVTTIILPPRNLRWLLNLGKICVSLFSSHMVQIFPVQVMRITSAVFRRWHWAILVTSSKWCCHKSWRWVPTPESHELTC